MIKILTITSQGKGTSLLECVEAKKNSSFQFQGIFSSGAGSFAKIYQVNIVYSKTEGTYTAQIVWADSEGFRVATLDMDSKVTKTKEEMLEYLSKKLKAKGFKEATVDVEDIKLDSSSDSFEAVEDSKKEIKQKRLDSLLVEYRDVGKQIDSYLYKFGDSDVEIERAGRTYAKQMDKLEQEQKKLYKEIQDLQKEGFTETVVQAKVVFVWPENTEPKIEGERTYKQNCPTYQVSLKGLENLVGHNLDSNIVKRGLDFSEKVFDYVSNKGNESVTGTICEFGIGSDALIGVDGLENILQLKKENIFVVVYPTN